VARIAVDLTALRRSRDLRLLTIGQACSSLGTQAALVALPYQVYVETDSPLLVGLIGAVELVPNVLGSLLGGAWADRVDRRRLMLAAQAVLTLVAVLLVVLSALGAAHVAALFVLAAALAASGAVVNVTRAAAVPALSGPYLRSALAINFSVAQLASIVGPGGGGLLISLAGVEAVYLLDAVAFALMLALAVPIRPLPPTDADAEHPPIARSIAEGLRFVAANRALLGSFVIDLAAMTFAMPRALFPVLALTVYDAGASGTGLLYASVSAGAVLAAVTTGWLERARWLGRITIVSVVVWGAAIALVGIAPSLWWAAALLALAGAADSVSAVCRSVINQVVTPEHLRGRMSSVFMLVVTSGPRLGDLRSGLAGSLLPVTAAVASGGLLCLAAVAVIAVAFPQLARYDSEREEARLRAAA